MPILEVIDLGRQPYRPVLELQRDLCRRRMTGSVGHDILLLVEHDPVVTLGRGTRASSLPLAVPQLEAAGYTVEEVERGGDVTIHEPGQLVGYPILDLRHHRQDLHWYLRQLESVLIDALGTLDIPAERNPGLTGVWTRGRKIASLGIHVKQWVTFHGFALNIRNDLRGFGLVVPCGIPGVTMTSVYGELGEPPESPRLWHASRDAVVEAMGRHFGRTPVDGEPGNLGVPPGVSRVLPPREGAPL